MTNLEFFSWGCTEVTEISEHIGNLRNLKWFLILNGNCYFIPFGYFKKVIWFLACGNNASSS